MVLGCLDVIGSVIMSGDVPFTLTGFVVGKDGVRRSRWDCGLCHKNPPLVSSRNHTRSFVDHRNLASCIESGRPSRPCVRLAVQPGHSPAVYVARGLYSAEYCDAVLAMPKLRFDRISITAGDTREQALFSMNAESAGVDLIEDFVKELNRAHPGSSHVVRAAAGYVIRLGSVPQAMHFDVVCEPDQDPADFMDSLTVFVGLSPQGRTFGVMGSAGVMESVHLAQGDIAILSAGCYHCGLVNPGPCEVLFFYLDRHYSGKGASAYGETGGLWDDLTLEEQAAYSTCIRPVGGFAGLVTAFRRAYTTKVSSRKRARK
jgi:hypothetical protein